MNHARAASTPPNANGLKTQSSRRSGLSVAIPTAASSITSQDGLIQLEDADDFDDTSNLGAQLTPTSNTTPSIERDQANDENDELNNNYDNSNFHSNSFTDSLPPLSISPAELENLHQQLNEKTSLLSAATDHISEQSVQIQRLHAQLQSQEQSNASLLSSSFQSNGEETRQFQLLVNHLHQMIAQRDEIISEQEKELNYYQQQLRAWKNDRMREVEVTREREARMKALEAELSKLKGNNNFSSSLTSANSLPSQSPANSKQLTNSSSFSPSKNSIDDNR